MEADVAGVVGVGCCCLRLAERLTEVCGPGMPGPYWVVKGKKSATGRNPSGAVAPPPFDKGVRAFFIANLPKTVALALA